MKRINKFLNLSIVTEVILVLIGILLCFNPGMSLIWVSYVAGMTFIIDGLCLVIFSSRRFGMVDMFLLGVLFFILGVILILNPNIVETIVPIILGLWLVVYGFVILRISIMLETIDKSKSILTLILSILTIIAGFIIIAHPHIGSISLGIAMGVALIVSSISSIVDLCIFKKYAKEINELLN